MGSQLEDEIESWKGFPGTLRKDDRELWDQMIEEVRQYYAGAVEQSGKPLMTDPFFMALILAQQRTIELLKAQLRSINATTSRSFPLTMTEDENEDANDEEKTPQPEGSVAERLIDRSS